MSASSWEVLTRVGDYMENVWSADGEPETFASYEEADAALAEHLRDCRYAVDAGHLDDVPPRSDFLIVQSGLSAAEFYRALQLSPPCKPQQEMTK